MIPTIETICEDLKAGRISVQQAIVWLYQHAEGAVNERRDMFAAMAMQALIAKSQRVVNDGPMAFTSQTLEQNVRGAFDYADAMLKEREA